MDIRIRINESGQYDNFMISVHMKQVIKCINT